MDDGIADGDEASLFGADEIDKTERGGDGGRNGSTH